MGILMNPSNSTSTSTSTAWSNGASSPTPKMESAYAAIGDKVYIIAGYGETGKRNKNSVEVYDTKTDTWTTVQPVTSQSESHPLQQPGW